MSIRDLINRGNRWAGPPAAGAAALGFYDAARASYIPPVVSAFDAGAASSAAPIYRNLKIDLSTLRANVVVELAGAWIWWHEWASTADVLTLRFDDPGNDDFTLRPGKAVGPLPFKRLFVSNAIQTGHKAELLILPIAPDALPPVRK